MAVRNFGAGDTPRHVHQFSPTADGGVRAVGHKPLDHASEVAHTDAFCKITGKDQKRKLKITKTCCSEDACNGGGVVIQRTLIACIAVSISVFLAVV